MHQRPRPDGERQAGIPAAAAGFRPPDGAAPTQEWHGDLGLGLPESFPLRVFPPHRRPGGAARHPGIHPRPRQGPKPHGTSISSAAATGHSPTTVASNTAPARPMTTPVFAAHRTRPDRRTGTRLPFENPPPPALQLAHGRTNPVFQTGQGCQVQSGGCGGGDCGVQSDGCQVATEMSLYGSGMDHSQRIESR